MLINNQIIKEYEDKGLITICYHDRLDLRILNYSRTCQFDKLWDDFTLQCRGLVVDGDGKIVSRNFSKFFNYEELNPKDIPICGFELFDKVDGSLGILFWYKGHRIFCTKGSFYSEQANQGKIMLNWKDIYCLDKSKTYVFEIIYPENRIVVDYNQQRDLIMLAKFDTEGKEYDIKPYKEFGYTLVRKYRDFFSGFGFLFDALKKDIKSNQEGYVLKFDNGFRMKIKGDEYVQLHKLKSNLNETFVWECLYKNIEIPLENLPDEWDNWLKKTIKTFKYNYFQIEETVTKDFQYKMFGKYNDELPIVDRKIFAEWVKTKPSKLQSIYFKKFDNKDCSQNIWKLLKPIKNENSIKI